MLVGDMYGIKRRHDEFKAWAKESKPVFLKYFYVWEIGEWLFEH